MAPLIPKIGSGTINIPTQKLQEALGDFLPDGMRAIAKFKQKGNRTIGQLILNNNGRKVASASGVFTDGVYPKAYVRVTDSAKGELLGARGRLNTANTPSLADIYFAASMRKGVIKAEAGAGDMFQLSAHADTPKIAEAIGGKVDTNNLYNALNRKLGELCADFRGVMDGSVSWHKFIDNTTEYCPVYLENGIENFLKHIK